MNILRNKINKKGSAMLLTMFILAGMLIVAMSGSYVILLGIKAGGIQAQSVRAYFAAESGAEKFLWELRQNGYGYTIGDIATETVIFSGTLSGISSSYKVFFSDFPPIVFTSIGEYQKTKRSVEVRI